ncbi:unnamed protein product [Ilex paraguariensis]|uniref:Cytochrome b5 heme-binding domain-containing protein n=1 Tax=Ilex paraguariensis TaxID=185542 RepID=A0ABC8QWQ8_9AQUA
MEIMVVVTVVLGLLLGVLVVIPRLRKLDHSKTVLSSTASKASKIYSKAEVSLHNKRTDCWIIIKEKVYDVTSYVEEHPGGDAILAHAGDDSTEGFFGPQHATRVFDLIDDFYIGELDKFSNYSDLPILLLLSLPMLLPLVDLLCLEFESLFSALCLGGF